jgi:hypothetical protein
MYVIVGIGIFGGKLLPFLPCFGCLTLCFQGCLALSSDCSPCMESSVRSNVKSVCNIGVNRFVQSVALPFPQNSRRSQTAFRQSIMQVKESAGQSLLSQGSVSRQSSMLHMSRDPDGLSDEYHPPKFSSKYSHPRQPVLDDRGDTSRVGHTSHF